MPSPIQTKPHYDILDGLRGTAALVVLFFHIGEAFATSHIDQGVNHGYLAVDFFFMLSGFVIGYAYDQRWGRMKIGEFFRRRLVRLHPMVVMGAVIGAAMFYMQDSVAWNTAAVGVGALLVATLLGALLVPVAPGVEVRGIGEMYPLNGPSWSLFFEYLGNILYALVIRRFSTRVLAVWVALAGCALAALAIGGPEGDLNVGWQLTGFQFMGGSTRLLFSLSAGLLLSRVFKPTARIRNGFWICSAALVALLAMPRIGGTDLLWVNGIYDTLCCTALFPLIVWIGASQGTGTTGAGTTGTGTGTTGAGTTGTGTTGTATRICKFLGEISYPLYMVHYPLIYLYYGWVKDNSLTFASSLPGAAGVVAGSVALAWLCVKFYDIPLRRRLNS